jgi:hypothetical protein
MTLLGSLIRRQTDQRSIVHDYTLFTKLIRVEKIHIQLRKVQSLMKEQNIRVVCHRVVIGESRCDNLDILKGRKLVMETIDRYGFACVMNDSS